MESERPPLRLQWSTESERPPLRLQRSTESERPPLRLPWLRESERPPLRLASSRRLRLRQSLRHYHPRQQPTPTERASYWIVARRKLHRRRPARLRKRSGPPGRLRQRRSQHVAQCPGNSLRAQPRQYSLWRSLPYSTDEVSTIRHQYRQPHWRFSNPLRPRPPSSLRPRPRW